MLFSKFSPVARHEARCTLKTRGMIERSSSLSASTGLVVWAKIEAKWAPCSCFFLPVHRESVRLPSSCATTGACQPLR